MTTEEKTALDQLLHAIDDLAAMVQYYCIGVYGIRDSFLDESLARAQAVSRTVCQILKQHQQEKEE
jgi:hypothetical protein